jgi:hypothetical protein
LYIILYSHISSKVCHISYTNRYRGSSLSWSPTSSSGCERHWPRLLDANDAEGPNPRQRLGPPPLRLVHAHTTHAAESRTSWRCLHCSSSQREQPEWQGSDLKHRWLGDVLMNSAARPPPCSNDPLLPCLIFMVEEKI